MTKLFTTYRVLALIVGVFLLVGTADAILKYALTEGSHWQRFGDTHSWVWMIHGWFYIVYVVVAFVLTQRARWTLPQFLLMMIAGLVPGLIFWVEHRVAQRLRAENPELATA